MGNSISVVTTVYNRAQFLSQAIESVLSSSSKFIHEYVIVDDASNDESWSIIEKFAREHDGFIRAYRNEQNLGDYGNRRKAVSLCTGDYVKFLDADDLFYEHTMTVFESALAEAPNCGLYLSWNVINPPWPFPKRLTPTEVVRHELLESNSFLGVGPSAVMFCRQTYDLVGGFADEQFVGDTQLWRDISRVKDTCLLPPSIVFWRIHESQQINLERKNFAVGRRRRAMDTEYLLCNQEHLSKAEIKQVTKRLFIERMKERLKQFFPCHE